MSAIAFQAGIHYGADHVFYLYLAESQFDGRIYPDVPRPTVDRIYPDVPRPTVDLIDFQEVF